MIPREGFLGLEWNEYLSSNPVVTRGERGISDNAVTVWRVEFQLFVDPLGNARVVPASWTVCAATDNFSCSDCEHPTKDDVATDRYEPFELNTITELMKWL